MIRTLEQILKKTALVAALALPIGCGMEEPYGFSELNYMPNATEEGKIAFTDYYFKSDDFYAEANLVNPDGSDLINLDGGDSFSPYNPIKISPDKTHIAFIGTDSKTKIADMNGSIEHDFTGTYSAYKPFTISWSPDNKSIIYGVYFDGIYEYNLETRTLNRILASSNRTFDDTPVISPDLSKIAFVHHSYGTSYSVLTMNRDGSGTRLITNGTGTSQDENLGLSWMNDEEILFKVCPKNTIYCANINTNEVKSVSRNSYLDRIDLSPDKNTLAITGRRGSLDWGIQFLNPQEMFSQENPACTIVSDRSFIDWFEDGKWYIASEMNSGMSRMVICDRDNKMYKFPRTDTIVKADS